MNKDLICCHTTGRFTQNEMIESMDKCREISKYIFEFYRNIVRKYSEVILL